MPALLRYDGSVGQRRLVTAWLTGLVGLGAYNWWVAVPFVPGMMRSTDGFFSDIAADGQPHALLLHRLDLTAGLLLLAALLLRGPADHSARRPEWRWLVAFAVVAAVGGMFPYACSAGYDSTCRHLERGFALPLHHYVHMVAGVLEFFTATMAIAVAYRTDPEGRSLPGRVAHVLVPALVLLYPLLGIAYLGDRWGAYVEPLFFLMFSAIVVAELTSPAVRSGGMLCADGSSAVTEGSSPAELGLP